MKGTLLTTTLLLLTSFAAAAGATVPGTNHTYSSDAVNAPATCTQSVCTQGTNTGPVNTPPVDVCIPSQTSCILHPTLQSVHVSDGETVPALCTVADAACQPGTTVLEAGFIQASYDVQDTDVVAPTVGLTTIQDVVLVDQPPARLVLCDGTPCPYPYVSPGTLTGGVTVSVSVAGQAFSHTVPLALP